jgi:hypothetical protein
MLHTGALMADATQPWAASWLTALEQLVRASSPSVTYPSNENLLPSRDVLTSAPGVLSGGDVYLHGLERACHALYARLGSGAERMKRSVSLDFTSFSGATLAELASMTAMRVT